MEKLILVVAIVSLIISIIVLVKFLGLCKNVERIANKFNPPVVRKSPESLSVEEAEEQYQRDIEGMTDL